MIQIQPWEKSMLKEIEKAIWMSDIGINPTNDGTVVRLMVPELSEERRKELVDSLQKLTDKYIAEVDKAVEAKSKEVLTV